MLTRSDQAGPPRIDADGCVSATDPRFERLVEWLEVVTSGEFRCLEPASSDASFRRYFRLSLGGRTLIAMDAPPERETIHSFVRVCRLFDRAGVHVPEIIEFNADQGFMLLGDLGSTSYLSCLDSRSAPELYGDAMDVLIRLRNEIDVESCGLPVYDAGLLRREFDLFVEWFLGAKLGIPLSDAELKILDDARAFLIEAILEQPKVAVHRDFHSRNLMVMRERNPGVLDFQDAVSGPLTYDLVSLLRDCYVAWPNPAVDRWVADHFARLKPDGVAFEQFYRWFDLTGLQRHLKAVGIFSRLELRDRKPGYLADIPRTLGYVRAVAAKYTELAALNSFLSTTVDGPMPGQDHR